MNTQEIISVVLFALLVVIVLIRAALLRKRGIKVIVFGKTDKRDFILLPIVLSIVYAVSARAFGLPVWDVLISPFWNSGAMGWIGIALCIAALTGLILTLVGFGNSFRVGIDGDKPDKLVTDGIFAFSRNPIYVCFMIFLAGLFLVHCNIVIAAAAVLFALAIHRQVLREERFLTAHYGDEYEAYRKKVRRYI